MSLHRKLSASSVLLATLLFTRNLPAQNLAADLVLVHGHILTVDANDSIAQAIAVRHGVIVKVGTDAEVLEFAGNAPGVRIIDLHVQVNLLLKEEQTQPFLYAMGILGERSRSIDLRHRHRSSKEEVQQ